MDADRMTELLKTADEERRKRINENRLKHPMMPDEVLGHRDCDEIIESYCQYSGGGSLGAFLAGWNAARNTLIMATLKKAK